MKLNLNDREKWLMKATWDHADHGKASGLSFSEWLKEKVHDQNTDVEGSLIGQAPPAPTCAGWTRVEDGLPGSSDKVEVETLDGKRHVASCDSHGCWWANTRTKIYPRLDCVVKWREIHTPTQPCRCGEMEKVLSKAISLLREVSEPGVFGPGYGGTDDPMLGASFRDLCERRGYGAVMHTASYLWEQKHPGCAHTVAAASSVREAMLVKIEKFLSEWSG